jgi:D-serine dehydratase
VQDVGLTGMTEADGLACARPSGFVGKVIEPLLAGEVTIADPKLYHFMRALLESENIFLEPSACASFQGAVELLRQSAGKEWCETIGLTAEKLANSAHIAWATGGALVPADIREHYKTMYL